jgi:hypothetical protein
LRAKSGNLVGKGDVVKAAGLPRRLAPCNGKLGTREHIITSIIDVKKTTAWGESGFPAGFSVLFHHRPTAPAG